MRVIKLPQFRKTVSYLERLNKLDPIDILHKHGRMGVLALSNATPQDTGEAASMWDYKIEGNKKRYVLTWTNSKIAGDVPLVILLQYGHATKSGYFIQGIDFINPALKPVYKSLNAALQREVFNG